MTNQNSVYFDRSDLQGLAVFLAELVRQGIVFKTADQGTGVLVTLTGY